MENSKIAWTDDTFNPWIGCMKVGPGCDNCYAEALNKRFGKDNWGQGIPRLRTSAANWKKPIKWNREAEATGARRKVFCASMADVFDNEVPEEWRADLFELIRATPWLDWILLTKRIGNVKKMLPADWGFGYPNVWLLITVVNQEEADRDIPKLLDTNAWLHGVSIEPQVGRIHLGYIGWPNGRPVARDGINALLGMDYREGLKGALMPRLEWVICGAESGPNRREFELGWARALRDQCQAAGTAFFLKQTPGETRKGVIETPELDGKRWIEFPESKGEAP